nr:hypothetical protein HK105_000897 [Polyrhizophydium stewartii]
MHASAAAASALQTLGSSATLLPNLLDDEPRIIRERKIADSDHHAAAADGAAPVSVAAAHAGTEADADQGKVAAERTPTGHLGGTGGMIRVSASDDGSYPRQRASASPSLTDELHGHTHPRGNLDHDRVHSKWSDYDRYENDPTSCINRFTVGVHDMPTWYTDNAFIYRGYRRITNSYRGCFLSLFYVHNESGNVYTHLVGVLLFLVLIPVFFFVLTPSVPTTSWHDAAVFCIFYAGAIACLGFSTTFHMCCCHSRSASIMWNKADYIGIVALIVGSFVPTIFYGFFCMPNLQAVYLTIFSLMGLGTIFITLLRRFSSPQYRYFRTSLFVALGVSGAIPLLHVVSIFGGRATYNMLALGYTFTMGAMYLVGAFIYAYRIPERWIPNVFDIWGHSHQIWHILVLSAAVVHYCGVVTMFKLRHANDPYCIVPPSSMASLF